MRCLISPARLAEEHRRLPDTLLIHFPQYWTLGQNMEYLCKLIGTTQATCVFFSGFSILLIAVDRYIFIVRPSSTQISTKQVVAGHSQYSLSCFDPGIHSLLRHSLHLHFPLLSSLFSHQA